jgi:ribosomal protein L37AE/L43A
MNIIALMGRSKSGKDTAGKMLVDALPGQVRTLAFADKLKEVCMDLYGLSWEDVYTEEGKSRVLEDMPCFKCPSCGSLRVELAGNGLYSCSGCSALGEKSGFVSNWTPRMILQHVGTEGCRTVDANVWVKFALRQAARHLEGHLVDPAKVVAITDCRFLSEAEAVWRAGGEVWRIRRPSTDRQAQGLAGHASETEMDTIPDVRFQRVIANDDTLDSLRIKVHAALAHFTNARLS